MEHTGDLIDTPAAEMAARIAALWRAQGEEFLADHHADVIADVDRLRSAVVVAPLAQRTTRVPRLDTERIVDRLRRLDAAAIERVAAGRHGAVIDLTGPEPVVTTPNDDGGVADAGGAMLTARGPWRQECRRCHAYFPDEMLVFPGGEKVRPLCMDCALVFSGLRRRR
jgi:hypothetical protein